MHVYINIFNYLDNQRIANNIVQLYQWRMSSIHRLQLAFEFDHVFRKSPLVSINSDWSVIPVDAVTSLGSDLSSSVMCDNNTVDPVLTYPIPLHQHSWSWRIKIAMEWHVAKQDYLVQIGILEPNNRPFTSTLLQNDCFLNVYSHTKTHK